MTEKLINNQEEIIEKQKIQIKNLKRNIKLQELTIANNKMLIDFLSKELDKFHNISIYKFIIWKIKDIINNKNYDN